MTSDIDSCCVALEIRRVVECERRSPQQPLRVIKCYEIVEAIDFDTGFASFTFGDNPILSLMSSISSLPPLMMVIPHALCCKLENYIEDDAPDPHIRRVVECERRSPQQPLRVIKCYEIVEAIDFDTGFTSFTFGDNPILSLMSSISSLPPLMVRNGGRSCITVDEQEESKEEQVWVLLWLL
nr:hypothetical protein [Tanacetum cinerariifolium]